MPSKKILLKPGKHRTIMQAIVLFTGLYIAAPANAFLYWQCGGDPTIWKSDATFRINRHNIGAGSSTDEDVQNAMERWTNTPGAWFDFNISTTNSTTTSTSDGQNRMEYHFPAHVGLAHSHQRYDTCITWWPGQNQDIEESDVHLVADWLTTGTTWQHGVPDPRSAAGTNLRAATVHELGHSLGLSPTNATHENRLLDNMNASVPAGGYTGGSSSIRNITLPDAARGFRFLYPGSANVVDMFVTNFRLQAGSTSATLVPSLPSCMVPGQNFTIFFTVGNRGNQNSPNSNCGVYMSTNDFISTSDTKIASCSWAPGANALVEVDSLNVRVPTNTPTGTVRYFGLYLDDGGTVAESIESNNKVAAPGSPNSTDGVRIQASCP
jgi:hypothetical protein